MKYVFLGAFLVLICLSAVAYVITPRPDESGRLEIVWASDDNPRRRSQIETFNQLHPGYELKLDADNGSTQKVITQSLAGVGPDVFDGSRNSMALLLEAGLLFDVTDELAKHGVTLDQFWPAAQAAMGVKGRIYGVPCNFTADGIWYHRDIFRAENVPLPPDGPWAWDDFVRTAQLLTKRDERGRVIRYGVMGLSWGGCVMSNGGRMFTPDGRRCIIDSPQAIEGVQRWLDLQDKYKVMPSPLEEASIETQGGWGSGLISLFSEKRAAMARGGRYWLCLMRDLKDPDGKFPLDLGVAYVPHIRFLVNQSASRVAYVNALSPHRDRAIKFLLYLASPEYNDQLNRDADGLPGMISMAHRPSYDYDPNNGRDGGNSPVWRQLCAMGVYSELSPYITSQQVDTITTLQIGLIRSGYKSVAEGLRQAAVDINAEIARNCQREPALKKRFDNGDTSPVLGNFTDEALFGAAAATQMPRPRATTNVGE